LDSDRWRDGEASLKEVIELLKKRGLAKPETVQEKLFSFPLPKVLDIVFKIQEVLNGQSDVGCPRDDFRFVASGVLSGHSGCAELSCRVRRCSLLARYAALYADLVVVPWQADPPENLRSFDDYRDELAQEVITVLAMQPAIEAGIIRLTPAKFHFCKGCASQAIKEVSRVREATAALLKSNFGKFSIKAEGPLMFTMRGPRECLEHGSIIFTLRKKPSWFPRGAAKILSKAQLRKSGMVEYIFDEMAESVIFQQLCAVNLNTKLLTSVQGEADILSRLAPRDEAATSVASLCAGLAHEVPLLADLPLRSVLKLRTEEPLPSINIGLHSQAYSPTMYRSKRL
jgi:hypothetical protein